MFEYMEFEQPKEGGTSTAINGTQNLQPFTWRGKMKNFLHSKPCNIAVIVLVLIDSILVITEILIDLRIVEVQEGNPAPEIVHYCSITILSIFMIEIAAKLLADWHHFWSHKMEIFDAIVVVVAFGFDIGVLFMDESDALVAVGLLILLRLWRVVRIVNGIILTVKNEGDSRVHALKDKLRLKDEEIKNLEEKVENHEKEIKKLEEILEENGIHVEKEPEKPGDEENLAQGGNGAVIQLEESHNVISIDT